MQLAGRIDGTRGLAHSVLDTRVGKLVGDRGWELDSPAPGLSGMHGGFSRSVRQ